MHGHLAHALRLLQVGVRLSLLMGVVLFGARLVSAVVIFIGVVLGGSVTTAGAFGLLLFFPLAYIGGRTLLGLSHRAFIDGITGFVLATRELRISPALINRPAYPIAIACCGFMSLFGFEFLLATTGQLTGLVFPLLRSPTARLIVFAVGCIDSTVVLLHRASVAKNSP